MGSGLEAFKLSLQQGPDKITAALLKSPLSLLNRSKSGGRKWEDVSSAHSEGIETRSGRVLGSALASGWNHLLKLRMLEKEPRGLGVQHALRARKIGGSYVCGIIPLCNLRGKRKAREVNYLTKLTLQWSQE